MNTHNIPTSKPKWTRQNCIGQGSFGVVNLAVYDGFNLPFAVKSVVSNSDNQFFKCLENEIEILKSLSSPYIVKYIGDDITCENMSEYRNLHMEYMSGGTVADVAKHKKLSEHEVRCYTRCITSALSYIHARNIVHCDVKGKNVLVGNSDGTVKLADFGSAVHLSGPVVGPRGSPLWMAPEVVRGEYQGPESDVWSLGCTVIEMITGMPAWLDRGSDTIRKIGYSDELPNIPSSVSHDLSDFLSKCLEREPNERWSCDQLLHHPFLLSCTSLSQSLICINDCENSPRCVFDWCDTSSSNISTVEIDQLDVKTSNAKQRIGKLASTSGVNWETEGWEVVRLVTNETTSNSSETTLEYSDLGHDEASVSRTVDWEYTESNASASYNYDLESTSNDARVTTSDSILLLNGANGWV
ncbi:pleckstrin homology-like domain-containing protein [Tanacetum coccineum]